MWRYLLRTVAQRLLLLIVISMISHAVIHLAPGEPSQVDPMNPMMKAADIARIRQSFHLDDPIYLQYLHWMRDLVTGELKSFRDGSPVLPRIWGRFLNSLPLFVCTTLIVWTASFPTGIQAALRRGSVYDRSTTFIAYTLISIPGFFLSYLLILGVVRAFHLPVIGLHTFGTESAGGLVRGMDRVWHLVIPSIMAAFTGIAVLSRYVRSQMLEVIEQDYVRTARAKGLSEDRVVYGHALRNALLPFVTLFGFLLPGLISRRLVAEGCGCGPQPSGSSVPGVHRQRFERRRVSRARERRCPESSRVSHFVFVATVRGGAVWFSSQSIRRRWLHEQTSLARPRVAATMACARAAARRADSHELSLIQDLTTHPQVARMVEAHRVNTGSQSPRTMTVTPDARADATNLDFSSAWNAPARRARRMRSMNVVSRE